MPEIELSEEAKDAMGHLDGSNVAEAREIGRGTKAPPFDPGNARPHIAPAKRNPAPTLEQVSFCESCSKRVPAGRERFCSNACMDDAQEPTDSDGSVQIPIDPDRSVQTCAIDGCGNPVPPRTKSGGKPKLYCSTTCAARARQQRGRKNWHGKWKHRRNGTAPKADPLSLRMKIGDLAFEGDGEAADVRKGSAIFFDTVKRRAAAYAEYVRWLNDGKRVAKLFEEAGGVPPELDALLPK